MTRSSDAEVITTDIEIMEQTFETTYHHPVAQLLSYEGSSEKDESGWPDYHSLGITEADIPELIRMATDSVLYKSWNDDDEDNFRFWATVHAWKALGQLKAEAAIKPLLELFKHEDDDCIREWLPSTYSLIGPAAIPVLANFIKNIEQGWANVAPARALQLIGNNHPEYRLDCIHALMDALRLFQENEHDINSLLIIDLLKLQAIEAVPLIKEVFESGCVDETCCGFWEDVALELGVIQMTPEEQEDWGRERLKRHRALVRKKFPWSETMLSEGYADYSEQKAIKNKQLQAQKNKQKRKTAKAAKLHNRKR